MKKKLALIAMLLLSALLGLWTSIAVHRLQSAKPRAFHYPIQFITQLQDDPRAGQKVYNEYCASCHAPHPIIDVCAPRLGNKRDWLAYSRLDKQELLALVIRGVGAMPARGGCFECDDKLLEKAVSYLFSKIAD